MYFSFISPCKGEAHCGEWFCRIRLHIRSLYGKLIKEFILGPSKLHFNLQITSKFILLSWHETVSATWRLSAVPLSGRLCPGSSVFAGLVCTRKHSSVGGRSWRGFQSPFRCAGYGFWTPQCSAGVCTRCQLSRIFTALWLIQPLRKLEESAASSSPAVMYGSVTVPWADGVLAGGGGGRGAGSVHPKEVGFPVTCRD